MTLEYLENGKKEAAEKMEAARIARDSAKSRAARLRAYDDFLFWQDKLSFFSIERKTLLGER